MGTHTLHSVRGPRSDSGRGQTPPATFPGPSPACSPGALLYNGTEPPCYLITLSEQLICTMYTAPSLSLCFPSRFNKP